MGYDVTRRTVPNINPLKEDPAGDYKITLPKNRPDYSHMKTRPRLEAHQTTPQSKAGHAHH